MKGLAKHQRGTLYEKEIEHHRCYSFVIIWWLLLWAWFDTSNRRGDIRFKVSEKQDQITVYTFVLSSVGYTRAVKDVSDDPEKMKLQFYPAFGGINGSIGAKYEFDLPLSPECKEIYVLLYDDYKLLIAKNPTTGEWEMV